jgi:hypothetical protein
MKKVLDFCHTYHTLFDSTASKVTESPKMHIGVPGTWAMRTNTCKIQYDFFSCRQIDNEGKHAAELKLAGDDLYSTPKGT